MGDSGRDGDERAGTPDDDLVAGAEFHLTVDHVELLFDLGVIVRPSVEPGHGMELERRRAHTVGFGAQHAHLRSPQRERLAGFRFVDQGLQAHVLSSIVAHQRLHGTCVTV